MKLSVVVSTYNTDRYDDTLKCLLSILKQNYVDKEVFLVLDPNEELYRRYNEDLFKYKDVKILINKSTGLSNARNMGIKSSTGDIIVFIDDDAYTGENYLENLVKNYKDPDVIAVGGKVLPQGSSPSPEEVYWIEGFTYKGYPENRCVVRNLLGCNMSFRKYVFNVLTFDPNLGKVGGNFITDEETEFCIRISSKFPDKKIIYDPTLVVYHRTYRYRQKLDYILRSSYNEGIAKGYISKFHKDDSLSTESDYLSFLLKKSIPNKIANVVKCKDVICNIRHLSILLLVILSVSIGYFSYKTKIKN
jgi:GT2 family glycosyltransferase